MTKCSHVSTKLVFEETENVMKCMDCGTVTDRRLRVKSNETVYKDPPVKMKRTRHAVLRCNGKEIASGRASHVWEIYLQRRVAGIPGAYEIRVGRYGAQWYRLYISIEDAEVAFLDWGMCSESRVARLRRIKECRLHRNGGKLVGGELD